MSKEAVADPTAAERLVGLIRQADFLSGEEPYSTYAALREAAPIHYSPRYSLWVLTRHRDVREALRARATTLAESLERDPRYPDSVTLRQLGNDLLHVDAVTHNRLRRLVSKAFTPQTVEDLRSSVERLVGRLLDDCAERGTFDVINDFADHIPVAIICEMLGVPVADIGRFKEWTFKITSMTGLAITDDDVARADDAMTRLLDYLRGLLAERQRQPREDLLSKLIWARDEGQKLSESETLGLAFLLLAAGSDTTTAFLGGAILALLRHPDQLESLRFDPGLMPRAIEELLRCEGPVHFGLVRTATEPLQLDGQEIPVGGRVWTLLSAANRDPEAYPRPDALLLNRDGPPQLAFGQGVHVCLGAPLARLEASVALGRLLQRFPRLELADDGNPWASHGNLRRMARLMVAGAPAA